MFSCTPHPMVPIPDDETLIALHKQKGAEAVQALLEAREEVIRLSKEDPLKHGFDLESWKRIRWALGKYNEVLVLGGNRCLAGEQEIYDPVAKERRRVDSINGDFHVLAWNESTFQVVEAKALAPFRKPVQSLYQIELGSGANFRCSNTHLVRSFGSYLPIADVVFLDVLKTQDAFFEHLPSSDGFHLVSTLDIALLRSRQDVQRLLQTVQGSQYDCRLSLHLCDGQPLSWSSIGLGASPSLSDVLERISSCGELLDDLENKFQHIQLCLCFDLLSNLDVLPQSEGHFVDSESRASCTPCISALPSLEGLELLKAHQQSIVEFSRQLQSSVLSGPTGIQLHCILTLGGNKTYYEILVKSDYLCDDVVWDFTVPEYHNYFIGNTLHHNSAKTTGISKMFMEAITTHMDGHVVLFSQNADTSVKVQQASMWEFMPKEFKRKTKGIEGYINYSMQNGFTGQSFIFPDTRTRVDFKTYTQFANNHTILEGFEFGFPDLGDHPQNLGIGNDEYLGDSRLINTQRFRLATRDSKLVTGFTPIDGYTELIADYLKDTEIIETKHAELLDIEVPVKQYSHNRDAAIVYLHTDENPFGGYSRLAKDLRGRPKEEILTRAYGMPVKSMTTLFPYFSTGVHVTDKLPEINKHTHTVYQVVDPAGARNYVAIWAAVDQKGFVTILREWPDRDTYGEWALSGDPKWRFGPAAKKLGYDVQAYIDEFKEIESELGVEVFERIGDSRFFARENEDNTDLFESFAAKGMFFVPSNGADIETGLSGLDEWMRYNPNSTVDNANRPIIQIHSSCGNLIQSLINWGHRGKADEPLKDWIDLLRYLRMANDGYGPDYVSDTSMNTTRKSGGGY